MKKLILVFIFVIFVSGCGKEKSKPAIVSHLDTNASNGSNLVVIAGMSADQTKDLASALEVVEVRDGVIFKAHDLAQARKWPEAIVAYEEAAKIKRFEWESQRGLSRVYEEIGDYQKAVLYLEKTPPQEWARPEYEKKLSELRAKTSTTPVAGSSSN